MKNDTQNKFILSNGFIHLGGRCLQCLPPGSWDTIKNSYKAIIDKAKDNEEVSDLLTNRIAKAYEEAHKAG